MIIRPSVAKGKISAPPSKSMAHRYLICAALADDTSIITNIDLSEDIKATIGCIEQLGKSVEVERDGEKNKVTVRMTNHLSAETRRFFCNECGSTLRFFVPVAMLDGKQSLFTGSNVLMSRPMGIYEDICKEQGISFVRKNGSFEISGKLKPFDFKIPGNISSQFITGLLFVLPLLEGNSKISLTECVESKPYIDMTIQVQSEFGIKIEWLDEKTIFIQGNQKYRAINAGIEGDYSNSAFFAALNTFGSDICIEGLKSDSMQGDKIYIPYFEQLKSGFSTLDISDCPDLGPILFVVAAIHHGGEFTGTKRLKIKESDRGTVMCAELAKFGIKTLQEENRIVIYEGSPEMPKETVFGHNDHRIVMAFSVLMTLTGGKLDGVGAVKKSFPEFFNAIRKLGIDFDFETEEESNGLDN